MGQPNHRILEYARDNDGELPEPFVVTKPVPKTTQIWTNVTFDEFWSDSGRSCLALVTLWIGLAFVASLLGALMAWIN